MDSARERTSLRKDDSGGEEEDPSDGDTRCDYFGWSPDWMQKLTDIKVYIVVYGLVGLVEGAVGSYGVATLTTIEKRFKLPSHISGLSVSSWDIGLVCSTFFLAYLGNSGRKPRWVAYGTFMAGVLCISNVLPHLIFGAGEDAMSLAKSDKLYIKDNSSDQVEQESCVLESNENTIAAILLIVSNLVLGMCSCTYYTLGFTYLDDNSSKDKAPFILALVFCIRLIGPTLGFTLAAKCLKLFIDPTIQPKITNDDPRWVGAWWMGWIFFGIGNMILAICMFPFPKRLPNASNTSEGLENNSKGRTIKDFKSTVLRLVKNKVLMYNSISSTLYAFGIIGYWAFMPKYIEIQFQTTSSMANLITGSVGLACTALGIISSGIVISYFKPSPRYLAGWNVLVESLDVLGHFCFAFFGCPIGNIQGSWDLSGKWNMTQSCNADLLCDDDIKYNPMCADDGSTTFFSPCHAGCISEVLNASMVYVNCSCSADGIIDKGVCPVDCNYNFIIFLILLCILRYSSASGRAANTMIQFRCVNPEDKAISIAFTSVMVSTFAVFPGPIIYGYMIDSTCLAWGKLCGSPGNCWLYEGQSLRYYLNFTASVLIAFAVLADIVVWQNVKGMKMYDKDFEKQTDGSTTKQQELVPFVLN